MTSPASAAVLSPPSNVDVRAAPVRTSPQDQGNWLVIDFVFLVSIVVWLLV